MSEVEKVNSIDEFLNEYQQLTSVYNSAQEILAKEQKTDNELYMKCIKLAGKCIRYLDDINPFVSYRHKPEICTTYYISAELLVRTVGLHMNRNGFDEKERNTLYMAIAHLRKVLALDPFNKRAMEMFKLVFLYLTIFNPNAEEIEDGIDNDCDGEIDEG